MNPIPFQTLEDFRQWLTENHAQADELWIKFYKKDAGKQCVSYKEAVDEALCFGWIDGIRKSIDGESYTNRFTPRRKGSNWSAVNIKRVGELIEMGRMQPAGMKAFEARDPQTNYSYEQNDPKLSPDYEAKFQKNAGAWAFFQSQAPSYRRIAIWWVSSAKQEATRLKRLDTLISDSEHGERIALVRRTPKK